LKTPLLESAARYYMPGLFLFAVALACLFDTLSREMEGPMLRRAVLGCLGAHIVLALAINQWTVAPILRRFGANYLSVAQNAAAYLKSRPSARPLRVLVEIDIGMISYFAGDACYFIDGGALATPSLLGKTLAQQLAETKPDYVIESLGERAGAMGELAPALRLVWHEQFLSHSLSRPKVVFTTNIYENTRR
jgi:hypothetical protein